jgi:hypothetical protein
VRTVHWQLSGRQRLLGVVLVLGVSGNVVACVSTVPGFHSSAATLMASAATNSWQTPDGIARAVAFRKSFGLRGDDAWVRSVASDPRALANVTKFSIPMTDAEVADFRTRLADRSAVLADLEQFRAAHVETWGGYYFDADLLVVSLIDPTGTVEQELRKAVPPPLRVAQARWSRQELDALALRVSNDPWLPARYHLLSVGADVEHNAVAIEVSSANPNAPAEIARHFNLGDELIVTIDGTGVAALPKGAITGKAVDIHGKPAAGLDIELVPDIPGADTGEIGRGTAADGSFEIGNIPAIGYEIRLVVGPDTVGHPSASQGIQVGEAIVEVKADKTADVTITVTWP